MEISAHYASMLLKMIKMSQHSDATGISAIQNVLIITRILIWEETYYTYAQWDAERYLLMFDSFLFLEIKILNTYKL